MEKVADELLHRVTCCHEIERDHAVSVCFDGVSMAVKMLMSVLRSPIARSNAARTSAWVCELLKLATNQASPPEQPDHLLSSVNPISRMATASIFVAA